MPTPSAQRSRTGCALPPRAQPLWGVPICRALAVHGVQIAPRAYWAHRTAAPSKRSLRDTAITEILAGIYERRIDGRRPPESLYGSLKMWAHLQRQGILVARCTVERIMRAHGWRGVSRARRTPRTTEPDPAAFRARQGHPLDDSIHHSDAGSQYTAIHFTETLILAGLRPSVGTVGDALDNGLAETTIGLYKTECIRDGSPFRPARSRAA